MTSESKGHFGPEPSIPILLVCHSENNKEQWKCWVNSLMRANSASWGPLDPKIWGGGIGKSQIHNYNNQINPYFLLNRGGGAAAPCPPEADPMLSILCWFKSWLDSKVNSKRTPTRVEHSSRLVSEQESFMVIEAAIFYLEDTTLSSRN